MQWLLALETEDDPIPACRLINVFRRKGLKIGTFNLTAKTGGFALMAVVDTPEGEVEHIFNFLRKTEGIRHVTYYRHEPSAAANFVFMDSSADALGVARFLQAFPESKIIFASDGKYLFEVQVERGTPKLVPRFGQAGFLPFARVRTTHPEIRPEMFGAAAD